MQKTKKLCLANTCCGHCFLYHECVRCLRHCCAVLVAWQCPKNYHHPSSYLLLCLACDLLQLPQLRWHFGLSCVGVCACLRWWPTLWCLVRLWSRRSGCAAFMWVHAPSSAAALKRHQRVHGRAEPASSSYTITLQEAAHSADYCSFILPKSATTLERAGGQLFVRARGYILADVLESTYYVRVNVLSS